MRDAITRTAGTTVFTLGIVLIAAGFTAGTPDQHNGPVAATIGDTLTVAVEIGQTGFDPREITLERDKPAHIVFTRTVEETCAKKIQIPEFGIEPTAMPLNEPVTIEVLPKENGTFTVACAMDMMKGSILVKSD